MAFDITIAGYPFWQDFEIHERHDGEYPDKEKAIEVARTLAVQETTRYAFPVYIRDYTRGKDHALIAEYKDGKPVLTVVPG